MNFTRDKKDGMFALKKVVPCGLDNLRVFLEFEAIASDGLQRFLLALFV